MSMTWFECKVKYRKTHETGEQKVKTDTYLLDAVSYTEAEARISEEMAAYTNEEFKITNIKVANFAEVHPFENSDRWFKSKVSLIALDEESGKEKKTNIYMLVQANDIKEAFENTTEVMQNTMGDYTIPSITESPILDVFPYFGVDEEEGQVSKEISGTGVSEEQDISQIEVTAEEISAEEEISEEETLKEAETI